MFGFFRKASIDADKPKIRQKAIAELSATDPALLDLVLNEPDEATRELAINKCKHIPTLITAFNESASSSANILHLLRARLELLLPEARDAAQLDGLRIPHAKLEQIATTSPSPALRLIAIKDIQQNKLLQQAALNDESSAVRQAALANTDDIEVFKAVIKQYKGKDKTLTRLAQQRLDTHLEKQDKHQQALDNLAAIQAMASGNTTELATFATLEHDWRELKHYVSDAEQAAWQDAWERAQSVIKQASNDRHSRQQIHSKAVSLLDGLSTKPYLSPTESDELIEKIIALQSEWQIVGSGQDPDSLRIERECNQVFQQLQQQYQILNQNYKRSQKQRKIIQQADRLLDTNGQIKASDVSDVESQWQRAAKTDKADLQSELDRLFRRQIDKLNARKLAGEKAAEDEQATLTAALDKLNQAVEQSQLQPAIEARNTIQTLLKNTLGLSQSSINEAQRQLQRLNPAVQALQGWAKWGGHQAREHVIADLHAATTASQSPNEIIKTLKAARAQWKKLDSSSGFAPQALRREFEAACDALHAPVKAHYETISQDQQANLAAREALCAELENLDKHTDWDNNPDWKALNQTLRTTHQRWQAAGGVAREDWKAINNRYHQARHALNARMKVPLEKEIARRERLIKQAQQLSEQSDIDQAISTVKQLRGQWQPTITTNRKHENQLWTAFNQACDAVFARKREQDSEQQETEKQLLSERQSLLDELRKLTKFTHWQDQLAARREIESLQQAWLHQTPASGPRADKLQQQWDRLQRDFGQTIQDAEREKQLVWLSALLDAGHATAKWETMCAQHETFTAEQINAQRTGIDDTLHLYPEHQPLLKARLAASTFEAPNKAQEEQLSQATLAEEIHAQVPSPSDFAETRRSLQISLLAEQMTQVVSETQMLEQMTQRLHDFIQIPAANATAYYDRYRTALDAQLDKLTPKGRQRQQPKQGQETQSESA